MIRGGYQRALGTALLALGGTGFFSSALAQTGETTGGPGDPPCEGEFCYEVQKRPTTSTTEPETTTTTHGVTTTSPPTTASKPAETPEVCVPPAVAVPPSSPDGAPRCEVPRLSTVEIERRGETLSNPEPVAPAPQPAPVPERHTTLSRTGPGNRLMILLSGVALMLGGLGVVFGDDRRRRPPSR